MEWKGADIPPEREGEYLACGQAIEWSMSEKASPDFYFISYWNGESWTHQENYGREFYMQYWTFLPIKPIHNQPERSKREDFKIKEIIEVTEEILNKGPQPPKLPNFKDAVL